MYKTVYFIRHSKPLKVNNNFNNDNLQIQNEKNILSIEGEMIARDKLDIDELRNIDSLYSSNYVRAIQTAKYIAYNNGLDINIVSDFGERKVGINSWNEYPEDFEIKQFHDEDYKLLNGESKKEVRERLYKALMKIITKTDDKRIAIVFHSTAMMFLLETWCKTSYDNDYYFKGKVFFDGKWGYCDIFKLEFYNKDLINIEKIDM